MNLLLILPGSFFSIPWCVHYILLIPSRADFFTVCPSQMVRVLSNVESALLHIYMPDMGTTRCFINIIVVINISAVLKAHLQSNSLHGVLSAWHFVAYQLSWECRRGPLATESGNNFQSCMLQRLLSRPSQITEHRT